MPTIRFNGIEVRAYGPSRQKFESRPQDKGQVDYVVSPKAGQPLEHVKLTVTDEHFDEARPFLDKADLSDGRPKRATISFFKTDAGGNCLVKVNRRRPRRLESREEVLSAFKLITQAPEKKGFSHYWRQYFLFAVYGAGLRERIAEVGDMWKTFDDCCKQLLNK